METQPAVETPAAPKRILPLVDNNTQAVRLAKFLFGPLARIHKVNPDEFVVSVERNGQGDALGFGKTSQDALEDAFQKVSENARGGKPISLNIIPNRPSRNIVEEKRRDLVIKLPEVKDVEIINALHPNEVLDVTELIQLRDTKAIVPYIAAATARNEVRKAEFAKLMKEAEKLKAEMVAAADTATPAKEEVVDLFGADRTTDTVLK